MSDLSGQEVPPEDLPAPAPVPLPSPLSGQEVPPEDLPSSTSLSGQEVPPEDLPGTPDQAPGLLNTLKAGELATERGLTGGLSDVWRTKVEPHFLPQSMQTTPQEIQELKIEHPTASKAGEDIGQAVGMTMLPAIGAPAGLTTLPKIGWLAKAGGMALDGALKMGGYQAVDQISNYLMGNQVDPASIKRAAALGAIGGGAFGTLGAVGGATAKGLGIKDSGKLLSSFLTGAQRSAQFSDEPIGLALKTAETPKVSSILDQYGNQFTPDLSQEEKSLVDPGMYKAGQLTYKLLASQAIPAAVKIGVGIATKNPTEAWGANLATQAVEQYLRKKIPQSLTNKVASAFMGAARSGTTQNIDQALSCAANIAKGDNILKNGVRSLFELAPKEYMDFIASLPEKNKMKDNIDEPEPTPMPIPQQGFADGGEVQQNSNNSMNDMYPEMNMVHSTMKGRVKGYLKSLRPDENKTRLPYDLNQSNPQDHHEYDKVVGLAVQPLSILKKIQNGSLTSKEMNHFISLYPELHQELSQRIHEQISENRFNDHPKPKYGMRQALSLFLGQDLDSSLSQPVMALAQSTFTAKQMQQQQGSSKEVKSKASLGKIGQSAATPDQARLQRQNEA